jgi:DNA repair protein RadD
MKTLRPDQDAALNALREAVLAGHRRICMQASTGFGKTVLAAALVNSALQRNKRVLFTVPAIDLIDQTMAMFASQGITEVGVIQADNPNYDWGQPVQIASVQTLMKRQIPKADVVLIDEVHIWFSFYERWVGTKDYWKPEWANVPFIGLSATPWTKGLGDWFDHFHKASTTQAMIDAGHLSPFRVYAPTHPDLSGIKLTAGDYNEKQLAQRMNTAGLTGDAVQTWLRLGEGRPTLCYGVDRLHAKALQAQFIAAGVRCGYQDGDTPDASRWRKLKDKDGIVIGRELVEGRKVVKEKFHSGEYQVVCNVGTLTMGIDWDVRCIVLCRPTKSDMLFTQIIGRGLRTAPGKDDCLILDHSDNHTRLGFVTDIDESYTGLRMGKTPEHENRTEGIRLPKECPKCAYLKPPKMAQCPGCGFVAVAVSKIKPDAGELRALKPAPKAKAEKKSEALAWGPEQKAHFFGELKCYAQRQGYQLGWASNKYRERLGVWPNAHKNAPLQVPSPETISWIKSRAIAWVKSKARNFQHAAE